MKMSRETINRPSVEKLVGKKKMDGAFHLCDMANGPNDSPTETFVSSFFHSFLYSVVLFFVFLYFCCCCCIQ